MLWASQVALGEQNNLRLRIYGDQGSLSWSQEAPDDLHLSLLHRPTTTLRRGGPTIASAAARVTRLPAGHPEGYLEAFATVYREAALVIRAHKEGRRNDEAQVATVEDGLEGMLFVEAALESSARDGAWVDIAASD
jgi:predicted dehydrogenase